MKPKDQKDQVRAEKAALLLSNIAFGKDTAERASRVGRDIRLTRVFGLLAYAIGWWGLIWADPYDLAIHLQIFACLTALLVAFFKRDTWSLTGVEGRIGIGSLAIMPSLTLGLRAYWDTAMMDWQSPLLWSLGGSAFVILLVSGIERRINYAALAWVGLFGFSATLGILVFANRRYDVSLGRQIPATVIDKSFAEYSGKRTRSYELFLSPWADRGLNNKVSVSRQLHKNLEVGDVVCVRVKDGWLGFAWYSPELCPPKAKHTPT